MRRNELSFGLTGILAIVAVSIIVTMKATPAIAQQERVLFNFDSTASGGYIPNGALISDAKGNLYGSTSRGGTYGGGTVYKLTRTKSGWTETVLHEFGNGTDGSGPGYGLIFDASGNLYGVTVSGGTGNGGGTVYELTPTANGTWNETILFNFIYDGSTGSTPDGNLIFDPAGNLYGATRSGGDLEPCLGYGCGTVYELSPGQGGTWTETILYASPDFYSGPRPTGGLAIDSKGNLYAADQDEIFELSPSVGGGWTRTVIHTFVEFSSDGYQPNGNLVWDAKGNLYGTTESGGIGIGCGQTSCGTVFELSGPVAEGAWTETILHNFNNNKKDGYITQAGVVFGANGVLYGTTPGGGNGAGCGPEDACGVAFALTPTAQGLWTEKILFNFDDYESGGYSPATALLFGPGGYLFGTTTSGGSTNDGTVFAIKP